MKKITFAALVFVAAAPLISSAQTLQPIINLIAGIATIFKLLVPLLIVVAIVAFFWGLVKYIWSGGKDATQGKNIMIAGLVSLFVMVTLWGIITFARNLLGIQNNFETSGTNSGTPPSVNGI